LEEPVAELMAGCFDGTRVWSGETIVRHASFS
jgi:hypothetical protein